MSIPEFPGRPDHPTFWQLSEIVLRNDGRIAEAEGDGDEEDEREAAYEKLIADYIDDHDSLIYTGFQRTLRVLGLETTRDVKNNLDLVIACTSIYTDAFIVGAEFERRKHQE